jgi:phosphoribosylformylglycinamidine cyclo-ligase
MERTFNMGIGMTAVVNPTDAGETLRLLAARGTHAWPLGEVTTTEGVHLTGTHPA